MFDRRAFLRIGSIATFGYLPFGEVLKLRAQAPAPPEKRKVDPKDVSVIHIFLAGGLSHLDTFDMKPESDRKYRSPFKPIPTSLDGLQICEHMPLTAKRAGEYVVIRSMTHKQSAHGAAQTLLLSGHDALPTVLAPTLGSIVAKELGSRNEMPPFVWFPQPRGNSGRAGFLGPRFNPFSGGEPHAGKYQVRDLDLPMGVDWARMDRRQSLLSLVDAKIREYDTTDTFETLDSYYQSAFELMRSPRAKKAFDIAEEPEKLREKYGRTSIGQGCLLARRLIENGVRFVTVQRGENAWDHHSNIFNLLANDFLPELDKGFAALLDDLSERSMLDSTMVIMSGEFGRTAEINVNAGRDHWPNCFTIVVAGAGIAGGRVWGASDADGMFVADSPVEVPDFTATLFHKLGVDYTHEYVSNIGRPFRISDGQPLKFLL